MVEESDEDKAAREKYKQGYLTFISKDGKYRYKLYMIDLLRKYGDLVLLENKFKSIVNRVDSMEISAIDSVKYKDRFLEFIKKYI